MRSTSGQQLPRYVASSSLSPRHTSVTSTQPASPRLASPPLPRPRALPALVRLTVPCLLDAQQSLTGEKVACYLGRERERERVRPRRWSRIFGTRLCAQAYLARALASALCRQPVTDAPRLGSSVTSAFPPSQQVTEKEKDTRRVRVKALPTAPTPPAPLHLCYSRSWTLLRLSAPCPSQCLFRRPAALLDEPSLTYAKKDSDSTGILPLPPTKTSRAVPNRPFFTHPSTLHHDHLWL